MSLRKNTPHRAVTIWRGVGTILLDSEFVTDGQLLTDAMFPQKKIFPNTPKTTFSNPDFHGGFEYKLCFYVRFQISSQITLLTDVTDGQIKTLTGDYKLLLSDRPSIFIANIADTPSFK